MTLQKAIEIQEDELKLWKTSSDPDAIDAIKLSIEALKARQADRAHGYIDLDDLLPGETPEDDAT